MLDSSGSTNRSRSSVERARPCRFKATAPDCNNLRLALQPAMKVPTFIRPPTDATPTDTAAA
jgi:hypothetical protein